MYYSQLSILSIQETERFAGILAKNVGAGDKILLTGEIGAGKTVLARALIRSVCTPQELRDDIPSPTYTLVQTYDCAGMEIWHADLYRLNSCWETIELGLMDAYDHALCIIEWGERLEHLAPADALWLTLENPTESSEFRFLSIRSVNKELIELLWRSW